MSVRAIAKNSEIPGVLNDAGSKNINTHTNNTKTQKIQNNYIYNSLTNKNTTTNIVYTLFFATCLYVVYCFAVLYFYIFVLWLFLSCSFMLSFPSCFVFLFFNLFEIPVSWSFGSHKFKRC